MLVYLTSLTWTQGSESAAFAQELLFAMRAGVHLLLVHELPSAISSSPASRLGYATFRPGRESPGCGAETSSLDRCGSDILPGIREASCSGREASCGASRSVGGDGRHACDFSHFFEVTPRQLMRGSTNIYTHIAITLKDGAWRRTGLALVRSRVAAPPGVRIPIEVVVPRLQDVVTELSELGKFSNYAEQPQVDSMSTPEKLGGSLKDLLADAPPVLQWLTSKERKLKGSVKHMLAALQADVSADSARRTQSERAPTAAEERPTALKCHSSMPDGTQIPRRTPLPTPGRVLTRSRSLRREDTLGKATVERPESRRTRTKRTTDSLRCSGEESNVVTRDLSKRLSWLLQPSAAMSAAFTADGEEAIAAWQLPNDAPLPKPSIETVQRRPPCLKDLKLRGTMRALQAAEQLRSCKVDDTEVATVERPQSTRQRSSRQAADIVRV